MQKTLRWYASLGVLLTGALVFAGSAPTGPRAKQLTEKLMVSKPFVETLGKFNEKELKDARIDAKQLGELKKVVDSGDVKKVEEFYRRAGRRFRNAVTKVAADAVASIRTNEQGETFIVSSSKEGARKWENTKLAEHLKETRFMNEPAVGKTPEEMVVDGYARAAVQSSPFSEAVQNNRKAGNELVETIRKEHGDAVANKLASTIQLGALDAGSKKTWGERSANLLAFLARNKNPMILDYLPPTGNAVVKHDAKLAEEQAKGKPLSDRKLISRDMVEPIVLAAAKHYAATGDNTAIKAVDAVFSGKVNMNGGAGEATSAQSLKQLEQLAKFLESVDKQQTAALRKLFLQGSGGRLARLLKGRSVSRMSEAELYAKLMESVVPEDITKLFNGLGPLEIRLQNGELVKIDASVREEMMREKLLADLINRGIYTDGLTPEQIAADAMRLFRANPPVLNKRTKAMWAKTLLGLTAVAGAGGAVGYAIRSQLDSSSQPVITDEKTRESLQSYLDQCEESGECRNENLPASNEIGRRAAQPAVPATTH